MSISIKDFQAVLILGVDETLYYWRSPNCIKTPLLLLTMSSLCHIMCSLLEYVDTTAFPHLTWYIVYICALGTHLQ